MLRATVTQTPESGVLSHGLASGSFDTLTDASTGCPAKAWDNTCFESQAAHFEAPGSFLLHNAQGSRHADSELYCSAWDHGKHQHPHINAPGWLRRCVSTTFRHRRQTFDAPSRPATAKWTPKAPVVGLGVAPRILPEHGTCGAAARAAAAAQNEVLDVLRRIKKERLERKVPGDAESGVDVDTRPGETETTMARQGRLFAAFFDWILLNCRLDPSCQLPKELFTQILSYLDARSLIHSELVSRQWYACASDRLVWKQAFNSDFRPQPQTAPENSSDFQVGGRGFGNEQAGQDWKRTWKVRKALHQRWTDTHAAAIYLEGHYDSVYCVQFDE